MQALERLRALMRDRFPRHPYVYTGLSGATLLHDALRRQRQSLLVLPAFICPTLSAMALAAGKRVAHIDSEARSMHIDAARLERYLATQVQDETAVLIDHSFGYRFSGLAALRRQYPRLLLIEDCARAVGLDAGSNSDWILFSMYKTIRGSHNGAVLLSRFPIEIERGLVRGTTIRERTANFALLRVAYDFIQRFRPAFDPARITAAVEDWAPVRGLPGELCVRRFIGEIANLEARLQERRRMAAELESLVRSVGLQPIDSAGSAARFVTFRMKNHRDETLTRLHRNGAFLSRTWDRLPVDYATFSSTFPFGAEGSAAWSAEVAHIPVALFANPAARRRLRSLLGGALLRPRPLDAAVRKW